MLALNMLWSAHNEEVLCTRKRRAIYRKCVETIDQMPETLFIHRFRLDKVTFQALCQDLRRQTSLKGTKEIPLEIKVLCALSFLATGSYQRIVGVTHHLAQRTASRCIREVVEALNHHAIMARWIIFPRTQHDRGIIKQKFQRRFGLPGVIGCIDCTHIAIVKPVDEEHLYYNRKGYHSLNVQMICDSDLRITNVNAKFGGATHDSHIWSSSRVESYMRELHRNNEQVWLLDEPKFLGSETNVTVVVGRDATLTCKVENLHSYKVAWLRVDTQTILTIGPHVITKNHRVGVSRGDQSWSLYLRDVRKTDGGRYMCQINTEPMITQTHHLLVFVPPDIVDSDSSGEVIVREGDNVTLHCAASGTPPPTVLWRREDSALFKVGKETVSKWSGVWLNMTSVTRDMNGAHLCIATNGVPPSVSKRILLHVLCKPTAHLSQKMLGAYIGETAVLPCRIEANPPPVVYWTHIDGNKLYNSTKYEMNIKSLGYKHTAILNVKNVTREDIGSYYCYAENSMGTARDDVTLYTLATTSTSTTTTEVTTPLEEDTTTPIQAYAELEIKNHDDLENNFPDEDSFVVVLSQHQMQNLDLSPSS